MFSFVFFCHDAVLASRQCSSLSLLANATVAGATGRWFAGRGTPDVRLSEQSWRVSVVATLELAVAVAVTPVAVAVAASVAVAVIRYVAVVVVLDVFLINLTHAPRLCAPYPKQRISSNRCGAVVCGRVSSGDQGTAAGASSEMCLWPWLGHKCVFSV